MTAGTDASKCTEEEILQAMLDSLKRMDAATLASFIQYADQEMTEKLVRANGGVPLQIMLTTRPGRTHRRAL